MCLVQNMPDAPHLPAALVAGAPRAPVAPAAVDGHALAWARLRAARLSFGERRGGTPAAVLWLLQHLARAALLAAAARDAASLPCTPLGERAVCRGVCHASFRLAVGRAPTWRCLLQVTRTMSTLAPTVHSDAARASHDAITRLAAIAPNRPIGQGAIHVRLAWDAGIATRVDPRGSGHRPATLVGLRQDVARAPSETTLTALRARLPILPVVPLAVEALLLVALLRVARLGLLLVPHLARVPAYLW
mmetsp:Transcript_2504/g.7505  ORF Transcript_2504/g.7505 Transcript_2504/m.7505 type:complete len:247 (+) Transcript_2504:567-1307(+)